MIGSMGMGEAKRSTSEWKCLQQGLLVNRAVNHPDCDSKSAVVLSTPGMCAILSQMFL